MFNTHIYAVLIEKRKGEEARGTQTALSYKLRVITDCLGAAPPAPPQLRALKRSQRSQNDEGLSDCELEQDEMEGSRG